MELREALASSIGAPTNPRPRGRGRPKKEDAEIRKWSIRLTPCDGEDVDFEKWFTCEDYQKFIAGREIGPTNGALHYHIYCETKRSPTWIDNQLYRAARWTPHYPKGNPVFTRKVAHEGTLGYSVKEEDVAHEIGFTAEELEAIIEKSQQYRRDLEAAKKTRTRKSQLTMKKFVEEAIAASFTQPRDVVKFLLSRYNEADMPFPSRSQMENAVMKVMYVASPNYVVDSYCRFL